MARLLLVLLFVYTNVNPRVCTENIPSWRFFFSCNCSCVDRLLKCAEISMVQSTPINAVASIPLSSYKALTIL